MKIKFNKFERVAGLFVLTAIVGSIGATIGVAIKRGWFDTKVSFSASFPNADGLHIGTVVQMAGLRAGSVDRVELVENNEVRVIFSVSEKFHNKIRENSVVRSSRPFVIGEKILDIEVGSQDQAIVAEGSMLKTEDSADIMDMMNGRKLGPALAALSKSFEHLRYVADAFLDPERTKNIVRIFDDLSPLIKNMSGMGREVVVLLGSLNKKQQLETIVNHLAELTNAVGKALPAIQEDAPALAQDLKKISHNMAVLSDEMQKMLPLIEKMAPEVPKASARAMEALDETVVVLKALQKSFMLKGNVKEVREEESRRIPANEQKD